MTALAASRMAMGASFDMGFLGSGFMRGTVSAAVPTGSA
jgi:hypothetical protein